MSDMLVMLGTLAFWSLCFFMGGAAAYVWWSKRRSG